MRIAVVTQYFWPEEFRVNDLVSELVQRGHDVDVLTGFPNYPEGRIADGYSGRWPHREEVGGATVTRVPLVPRGPATGGRLFANYLSFAATATALGPALVRGPVDAVLAFEPSPVTVAAPALALARAKRAPALMWVQDLWPDTLDAMGVLPGRGARGAASAAAAALHRAMDGLLLQSEAFAAPLRRQGVLPDRLHYIPNWAEDLYRPVAVPPDAPERRDIPDGFTVLFAGNIGVAQGLEIVVDAAEELRDEGDVHWVILGSGRQAAWIADQVQDRKLDDNVHLPGRRPAASMPAYFALADVLLATLRPDPVYELTLPSKLQTYFACGRPILAALDGEGARVVREARAGLATPAGNASALASAVRRLYSASAETRAEMGRNALRYAREHFDRSTVIDRIEQLLQEYATRRRVGVRL